MDTRGGVLSEYSDSTKHVVTKCKMGQHKLFEVPVNVPLE